MSSSVGPSRTAMSLRILQTCRKARHRGIPERTTAETRERELLHECENRYSKSLVQRPCEGAPAEEFRSVRFFLEELCKRPGDVLEDLAVLLRGEPRRDADVGDEEFVVLAAHRKSAELRAALEERLHLLIKLRLDSHGSTLFPRGCASPSRTRARPGYAPFLQCRRDGATSVQAKQAALTRRLRIAHLWLIFTILFREGMANGQIPHNSALPTPCMGRRRQGGFQGRGAGLRVPSRLHM